MDEHLSRSDGVGGRGLLVLALIIISLLGLMAFIGGTGSVVTSDTAPLGSTPEAEQVAPVTAPTE